MIELDHFSLGVANLYEGAHRLREETGLDNYDGGWSEFYGAANRIVPLPNDVFIEVESWIVAGDLTSPAARWALEATASGDSWMFWCLRASTMDEMEAIAKRLGSSVLMSESARIKPNGERVGVALTPASMGCWAAGLPNWYYREDPTRHPAREPVNHRRPFTGVTWIEVGGDPEVMEAHVGAEVFERLPLRFVDQPAGLYAVAVGTADGGDVVIRRPSAMSLIPPEMRGG